MASTYSDRLKLELQGTGENAGTWGDKTNNNLDVLDAFAAGYLSKNVGGSSNVTLTTANASATSEASNKVIELTGTLTGNITVFIPAKENNYIFFNNTAGSFTLDIAPTGHGANSVAITQGSHTLVYSTSDKCVDMLAANVGTTTTTYIGDGSNLTNIEPFPAGTSMLFQQTAAPTGWTKQTTHDNKALRLVTGSVSSSGSNSFTSVFNSNVAVSGTSNNSTVTISGSTAGHVLTKAQLPDYTLVPDQRAKTEDKGTLNRGSSSGGGASYEFLDIPSGGSDEAHSHGTGTLAGDNHSHTYTSNLNLDVEYVDFIIANKD